MVIDDSELVLVAHGTRHPAGLKTIGELADALSVRLGPVRTAFVDVLGPNPREVLAASERPAVVVPAFLASGYHVNKDLPERIRESGHPAAVVTPALGPDPVLAEVLHLRLTECGWRPGEVVVMAAAGSSDPAARHDVFVAADLLARRVGEVHVGFVATGAPKVTDVVTTLRRAGRRRIFIASYLLAPGVFHTRLLDCGVTAVAEPLGPHPKIVELLSRRFADAAGRHRLGVCR
jgi:sirohydrochlorin ferrochelatase